MKNTRVTPIKISQIALEISQIAQSTVIKGKVKTTEDLRLDGIIEGDLTTQGRLVTGETCIVTGNLKAETIIVTGEFKANSIESVNLVFQKNARFTGNAFYKSITLEAGAQVNGKLNFKE